MSRWTTDPGQWRKAAQRLVLHRGARIANGLVVAAALVGFIAIASGRRPQAWWFVSFAVAVATIVVGSFWVHWMRERVIRESPLPQFLKRKLRETYPHLSGRDGDLVERAFRQFFVACRRSGKTQVAMPSRGVDAYWHEFILHTKAYRDWCDLALGRFLDHTPSQALGPAAATNDGLRRAWFWSCREESIDPRKPSRLPLLFAIDAKLKIPDGFVYAPNCRLSPTDPNLHCATDFSSDGYGGDASGLGGADSPNASGDVDFEFGPGDGCGSGDGGGGCGGD